MNSSADLNRSLYNKGISSSETEPHVRHASLRRLYSSLLVSTYGSLRTTGGEPPHVIDLGAGDGTTTIQILDRGANITAVDVSEEQLRRFRDATLSFPGQVDVICGDVDKVLDGWTGHCDMVMAVSFLHHIPDYLSLIAKAIRLLKPGGMLFTFQDPMAYDSVRSFDHWFGAFAYYSWRAFRGDLIGGLARYARRRRGVFLDDSQADTVEYHVLRNGVDQRRIGQMLEEAGFATRIIRYHSTHSALGQRVGERLGVQNHFAVIARKPA